MKEGRGAGIRRRSLTAKYDPASDAPTQRVESDGALEKRLRAALAPNLLLVRAIGAGGMARVFLARQPALKRLVAVKVLSGDLAADPDARKRFEREAQAVAALSHPNIVAIHGVGELDDGTPYFVMQYVEGRSMAARVEQDGPLSLSEARRVVGEVAAALAAAHRQGIIHRDIKPANILYEESSGRALVSDFGIAAMSTPAGSTPQTRLTGTGMALGTPQYMSPEQLTGEPVTDRTDIYSLGLLAHELLVGSGPYRGSSAQELIAAHLRDTAPRLSVRRTDVEPELDELVARCLEKDAAKRPTAAEIARRLTPGGAALLEWPPPGLDGLHGRARRLSLPLLLGSALIAAALLPMMIAGPRMNGAAASLLTLVLFLLAGIGAVAMGIGIRRASTVATLMADTVRQGYGWMTVAETFSDVRGDTGHIMTASREYASLDPRDRDRWRRRRVLRETLLLLGGIVPVPLLAAVAVFGPLAGLGTASLWVLVVPLALVAGAMILADRERRAFAEQRRLRGLAAQGDLTGLVRSWNESFEDARGGRGAGRGIQAAPWLARVGLGAAAILVLLALLLAVPLVLVGVVGPGLWTATLPQYAQARTRVAVAEVGRGFAIEKDASISPLAAGRALYALQVATGDTATPGFAEHPVERPLPSPPWSDSLPAHLFRGARDRSRGASGLPVSSRVLALARDSLTAAELAYLERIAHAPHWAPYGQLARATTYDYLGARYLLPFTTRRGWWDFPAPRVAAIRLAARASVLRAAWHLSTGRADSAEVVLRETIAVGLLLIDEGTSVIEQLIGALAVDVGQTALADLYTVSGDARGAELRARIADVASRYEARQPASAAPLIAGIENGDVATLRPAIVAAAANRFEKRAVRLEMLVVLSLAPCTNVRELVFGPASDVEDAFALARKTWTRFPSDSALLDHVLESPWGAALQQDDPQSASLPARLSRAASSMTRNPRFAGCAAMLLRLR